MKMYIGLHVKYRLFMSDFNEILNLLKGFRKIIEYEISWKSPQWEQRWNFKFIDKFSKNNLIRNFMKISPVIAEMKL
jgi:hypothetical protein